MCVSEMESGMERTRLVTTEEASNVPSWLSWWPSELSRRQVIDKCNNKSHTAGRFGERRRWRADSHQLEQPGQSVAVDLKGQSLPSQVVGSLIFFFFAVLQAYIVGIDWGVRGMKKHNSITPFCSQSYFIHALSINVYSYTPGPAV